MISRSRNQPEAPIRPADRPRRRAGRLLTTAAAAAAIAAVTAGVGACAAQQAATPAQQAGGASQRAGSGGTPTSPTAPANQQSDAKQQPDSALRPDTADGLGLPVQAYLMTGSDTGELTAAQAVLTSRCMKQFGFDFTQPAPAAGTGSGTGIDSDAADMSRRYGISDAQIADQYGYHLPPLTTGTPTVVNETVVFSDAEYETLWGHTKESDSDTVSTNADGAAVPKGGCMAQAEHEFAQGIPTVSESAGSLPGQINVNGYAESEQDPGVVAALKKWSSCMAASGYHAATPIAALAPFTGPLPASAAEIAEAKTDLACKAGTRLIQTWDAAETAIENRLIAQDHTALAQDLQIKQDLLKKAAQLLG